MSSGLVYIPAAHLAAKQIQAAEIDTFSSGRQVALQISLDEARERSCPSVELFLVLVQLRFGNWANSLSVYTDCRW